MLNVLFLNNFSIFYLPYVSGFVKYVAFYDVFPSPSARDEDPDPLIFGPPDPELFSLDPDPDL